MDQLCDQNLPAGMGHEWTNISYQEYESGKAGVSAGPVFIPMILAIFSFAIMMVFFVLSALVEQEAAWGERSGPDKRTSGETFRGNRRGSLRDDAGCFRTRSKGHWDAVAGRGSGSTKPLSYIPLGRRDRIVNWDRGNEGGLCSFTQTWMGKSSFHSRRDGEPVLAAAAC
jgi:hypothetical protein